MKNQIIIDTLVFFIKNFNGTNQDYRVEVSLQDMEESDMYTINIFKDTVNIDTFYVDSCGGLQGDVLSCNDLEMFVLDTLFVKQKHGIIRGF